jgi:Spy/CpxP family protein refolding chaperone
MNYFKNNIILLLVITALILVNLALVFFAFTNKETRKPPMTQEERMRHTEEKLKNEVGFNDDQIKKYEELRKQHFESIHPKFEQLEQTKESFLNLVYQNNLTDSAIQSGSAKICEEQRSIDEQMLRHFVSLRQLATEEQRPKLDSFLQRIIKRMTGKGPGPDREKK